MDCETCSLNGRLIPYNDEDDNSKGKPECTLKEIVRTPNTVYYVCQSNYFLFSPEVHGEPIDLKF